MKKKYKISLIVILIVLGIGIVTFYTFHKNSNKIGNRLPEITSETKIKSGNLSTDYKIELVLKDIEDIGLDTINIPVVINIDSLSSSSMKVNLDSRERALKLLKKLGGKNIKIILEPYPWIGNGRLSETAWKPADMDLFFNYWKTVVLKTLIDDIAIPYNIFAINIGSNLEYIEQEEEKWCETIDYVRKYYKGLVTYRTNWWSTAEWDKSTVRKYEKKISNKLFSKLDFISVATYFELTEKDTNTVEGLMDALQKTETHARKQNVKQEIKKFQEKWNKPIFFGELGFPRVDKASMEPWNPNITDKMNNIEQANCFEAYRRTFEQESWLLGFSVFAIGEHGSDKRYYPGEEAKAVIKNWYKEGEK